ncbi:Spectrin Alpha Chain, Erythrocytic 1 [Manis pentadactyla]|nr:Spectrin Alpha Chain, Erythrocytic 1 [Manis pentadactyla]
MWMYLRFGNFTTQTHSEDAPPAAGASPCMWPVTGTLFAVANWGRALVAQTGPRLNEQGARSAVRLGDGAPLPTAVESVGDMLSSVRSAEELPGARILQLMHEERKKTAKFGHPSAGPDLDPPAHLTWHWEKRRPSTPGARRPRGKPPPFNPDE